MSVRRGSGRAAIQSSASDIVPSSFAVDGCDDSATAPMTVRMAGRTGTFGWLRTPQTLRTMVAGGPHMALASIPATTTDGATSPVDTYLLEMYRQAAESTRPSAGARASSIGAFLAFVGVVTAVLAVLFTV